jgi:hypothetical protein
LGQGQEPKLARDEARGRGRLVFTVTERPQKITFGEMRESGVRGVLITVLSVLLIATLTIQTATATARHARKSARERDGFSAPAAVQSRSCDRLWCYEDGAAVSASRK